MEKLSQKEFENLIEGAAVIERDSFGIKVLETADRKIIKLFRLKRRFSSARLFPYALRFKNNSERLKTLGIAAAEVERVADCPAEKRHLVIYGKLEGEPLREILGGTGHHHGLLVELAAFIAVLHQKGVYFRSMHLGNILFLHDRRLALIDLADMRTQKSPLSAKQRARNFRHLLRYRIDRECLMRFGLGAFIDAYLERAGLEARQALRFRTLLIKLNPELRQG